MNSKNSVKRNRDGNDSNICKCPPHLQKLCRKKAIASGKDVEDIIQALEIESQLQKKSRKLQPPMFKTKPFKPRHFKDTCVPMTPSMHTRLRYIGHCPVGPMRRDKNASKAYEEFDFSSSSEDDPMGGILRRRKQRKEKYDKKGKKVRYSDLCFCAIELPRPANVIKHTESDKSILSLNSPNVSGENITAQKATVKPAHLRPPLPPKSGLSLFKPHSGIVLNRDAAYVPEMMHFSGKDSTGSKKKKKCYKGRKCPRRKCTRKECRKYANKRRRLGKRSKSGSDVYSVSRSGARDGKPRSRSTQRHVPDGDDTCGLDEIPRPEHAQIPANLKKGMFKTHSLSVLPCRKERRTDIHYGILTGSFNMYDNKFSSRSRGRQALPMSVMAYCLAFHYHPKQWTMKLVDNLVDAGDQWYLQCADKVHDHSAYQGMCEVLHFGKKQILLLNGKKMQVLLSEPEIVGYTMSLDPTVYNLCRGLNAFFKENRAGIMLTRVLKLVIWKDKICYYVFDPAGRNSRAYSNYASGYAALMNVKDLPAVAELLLNRSILEDQKYVLAPVKVLKMIDEKCDEDLESDPELTLAEKAMMGYRILSQNCAIVNANMHLGDRCFETAKFRQALPVAVVAMTYAKISPPNTWHTKTLDKILRLGNKLYLDCVQPKVMIDLSIDNIPNEILMGPYACEIIIYRERVKGQLFTPKECINNIKRGLQEFFSREYSSGILEFNNYTLAVWRQKEMYYLFDPYPRTTDGARSLTVGKACCLMFLDTEAMADSLKENWDYLPPTNQFYIHAFKVLKLKKKAKKTALVCTLSDDQLPGAKNKKPVVPASQARGDGKEVLYDVLPMEILDIKKPGQGTGPPADEEQMGDIVSLVDSIQEDYVPPIPMKYKNMPPEPLEPKVVNLDSPTVSVTQVVPPWPKPREKPLDPLDIDPEPEPTPPPTPPPLPPPEGAEEEEEMGEEELDEEAAKKKKEDEKRKKAEEEEARRKAEELPPPMAPPPPSPQPEPEVPLAVPMPVIEDEMQAIMEQQTSVDVDRQVLLAQDARYRFKLRQLRKKVTAPLEEEQLGITPSKELVKPHNFKNLPDNTQIIRGTEAIPDSHALEYLPFTAIMAIVLSYKYTVNTWTKGIVTFVIDSAKKLYQNKKDKFQLAPVHIIPKIRIGHQAYNANIDVAGEGPTWQLQPVLDNFLLGHNRGMVTTTSYSCAFFKRNGLYYLYDGSPCNAMGLRDTKGSACLMRFRNSHDLVCRILYNKDGKTEDQQFILSKIVVRRLLPEARFQLPEDYSYDKRAPASKKSKLTFVTEKQPAKKTVIEVSEPKSETIIGYQLIDGTYKVEGTTSITNRKAAQEIKSCHFISLIAMLLAAMHPIRTWSHVMVDTCIEKGLEIFEKANNLVPCEKRIIRNIILDGRFININIKKIAVVNMNPEKTLEQYLKAVLRRLRYVMIRYPECSMVICQTDGYYHLFDPYPGAVLDSAKSTKDAKEKASTTSMGKKGSPVAAWTLYRTLDELIARIKKEIKAPSVNNPEFYTFELTSVKTAPKGAALNYRLSPLFRPDDNPNMPYLRRRKITMVDEKMYWLDIEYVPWSRMNPVNDLGFDRNTPKTLWKDWDIEFPGDLCSLWGSVHPLDTKFPEKHRGKQYLCCCVIALVMTEACHLSAWTGSFLDGIVETGDKYFKKCVAKFGDKKNHELAIEDLDSSFDDMYPYSFTVKFEHIIFGFIYNMLPDRFNLSKAMSYFFEKNTLGILTSPSKNLAFGKSGTSYFLFDCQSYGAPVFCPGQGASYMLKCESLNRLIYCMAITMNLRRHGQQFNLYSVAINLSEKK